MTNKRCDLRSLFRDSLERKRKALANTSYTPNRYDYCGGGYNTIGGYANSSRVYFYEWSNLFQAPRVFQSIISFEQFCRNSKIDLPLYMKDLFESLGYIYATCYPNTHDICVRGNYRLLLEAVNVYKANQTAKTTSKANAKFD
jgi:hypothetical protein